MNIWEDRTASQSRSKCICQKHLEEDTIHSCLYANTRGLEAETGEVECLVTKENIKKNLVKLRGLA